MQKDWLNLTGLIPSQTKLVLISFLDLQTVLRACLHSHPALGGPHHLQYEGLPGHQAE